MCEWGRARQRERERQRERRCGALRCGVRKSIHPFHSFTRETGRERETETERERERETKRLRDRDIQKDAQTEN